MSEWAKEWASELTCVCISISCLPVDVSGDTYILKELLIGGSTDLGRDMILVWEALTVRHHYSNSSCGCPACSYVPAFRYACVCGYVCVNVLICVFVCHTKGNYADSLNEGGIIHILHCNHLQQFMSAINLLIPVLDILQIRLWHLFHFEGNSTYCIPAQTVIFHT